MAIIYNSDLAKEIVDGAKIQQNVDSIPNQLAEKVVPVMEVNPKMLRIANFNVANSSAATGVVVIYTTPTDKDFYLTGFAISYTKDAACDVAFMGLTSTMPHGGSINMLNSYFIPATAQSNVLTREFTAPILLGKGAAVNLSGTYTAGTMSRQCTLIGYLVDNIKA